MALTFAIPDSVVATTMTNYSKTMNDNIFKKIALYSKLYSSGQVRRVDGGVNIAIPLLYGKNTTVAGYSKYGIIDTTPQDGITGALFNWKQIGASITISGLELRQNSGANQVVDLLKTKVKQAEMSVREYLGQKLFASGTTDAGTDPHGLATLVATTGTVGGISKSANSWWQSQTGTAASFAANGLDSMRTLYNSCMQFEAGDQVNFIITDQTNFERYEKVLQPQERFNDAKTADGGFQNLLFKGVPIVWDPFCTTNRMYFLNTNYLELVVHSQADMVVGSFIEPENQDAKVAKVLWQGELTNSNASKQGVLTISAA